MNSFLVKTLSATFILSLSSLANAINTLNPGESLNVRQSISSNNGCFKLIMQNDGNLVLYRNSDNIVAWATNTSGTSTNIATMQTDGNFVTYKPFKIPTWASQTSGKSNSKIVLQDDGNLVIYQNSTSPIWASNTTMDCYTKPTPPPPSPIP